MNDPILTKSDRDNVSALVKECWLVCATEKPGNDNSKFWAKLNDVRGFLCPMCKVDESGMRKSFLTKAAFKRIMDMVMHYAWNCWNLGDGMFPWEDAERDDAKTKLEEYLDTLVGAKEEPLMAAESNT